MPNFNGLWTSRQQLQARGVNTWPARPGAPTSPVATAGNMSASVAFTAPADTGFPPNAIIGYRVTSSPGGFTGTGLTSPVTVSGLTNGTAYTFTVAAQNVNGFGPESAASNSVTPVVPNYIEEVFQTWLYTGNGNATPRTIQNNIDLSTKKGLVWIKSRTGVIDHDATDTVRGARKPLFPNSTVQQDNNVDYAVNSFLTNGFTLASTDSLVNQNNQNYVSWTFREQPKFFDIQTWTSTNSSTQRTISHNLGSTPGCVIFKSINNNTNSYNEWYVAHRYDLTAQGYLNRTFEFAPGVPVITAWTSTTVTFAANFNEGSNNSYIVYIFAHNAGGFGNSGNENVITCGNYTGNGSNTNGTVVNLGYEPQWLLIKRFTGGTSDWLMVDNMRGMTADGTDQQLKANSTSAEDTTTAVILNSTGFQLKATGNPNTSGAPYIYIAIRRGPMAVPTTGTNVFSPTIATTNIQSGTQLPSAGFPVDLQIGDWRNAGFGPYATDRLRGGAYSYTFTDQAESSSLFAFDSMTNVRGTGNFESTTNPFVFWQFRRAAGFFDEVCYTGNATAGRQLPHNLTVVPEFIITKNRGTGTSNWVCYHQALGPTQYINLNETGGGAQYPYWNDTTPTATNVILGTGAFNNVNINNQNYVMYLFASAPGVSKVGSYVGTGATQLINCGFAAGARYVVIKAASTSGSWLVWDTARGMVVGTSPRLPLNSITAEANANWVYTATTGFQLTDTSGNLVNSNGVTYIYLAIA